MSTALVAVTVKSPFGTRDRVKAAVAEQRAVRLAFASDVRWATAELSRREAAAVRGQRRAALAELRAAGQLLDSVDRLAVAGTRHEMRERRWNIDWPPVPAEALDIGRWPGSRDGGYPESIPLRLPLDLAEQVRAACWHTSADAIGRLRDWRDRYPDAIPGRDVGPTDALAEYERLAQQVTTVGVVYRAGLELGIAQALQKTDCKLEKSRSENF
ncbi:hypothetical protein RVR_P21 (plasmid) [Actinacidiphila reveromycinica]|uniref:Uncharacterized protein n=1 Tax=Actinacidiphila reveromycinica TaxID=659352 RepID=A0A7R6QDX7_9ACTN|nr:hypothetical protein [Streptomyces sp. SN-593]BBG20746.1 hypothetical protein RVR_P21 [Streptomyces sp. SN-593]